jgi:hypothetical protein
LTAHYDGGGNKEKIVSWAEAILRTITYKNESAFSFENFSSKLLLVYCDLEKYERPKTPNQQVQELLENIKINEARVEVAKAHVRQNFRENVHGAVYPEATFLGRRSRFISAAGEQDRDNQRQRMEDNEPQTHADGTVTYNGVDVTDVHRSFSNRSHTRILIFVQNAPIIWFSKKQNTVESASFGSDFVALRAARDMIVALRYKLRMFGIPVIGPANVLCDNQGVVKNTSIPESTLSQRHNSINYHTVRESAAAGILQVGKEDGETNLSDVFTKVLGRVKRYQLFSKITYSSMYGGAEGPPKKRVRLDAPDP